MASDLKVVAVVLAAGLATRYGSAKLLVPVDGIPLIERTLAAARALPIVLVASPDVAAYVRMRERDLGAPAIVENDAPERGMAHSLRLADAIVARDAALLVLLADMPNVDAALVARVVAAYETTVDVVAPYVGTTPAHPVLLGPRVRTAIAELPDGDSIRQLRDSKYYRRLEIALDDPQVLHDVDRPSDITP